MQTYLDCEYLFSVCLWPKLQVQILKGDTVVFLHHRQIQYKRVGTIRPFCLWLDQLCVAPEKLLKF